jgi:hypothetical protein
VHTPNALGIRLTHSNSPLSISKISGSVFQLATAFKLYKPSAIGLGNPGCVDHRRAVAHEQLYILAIVVYVPFTAFTSAL